MKNRFFDFKLFAIPATDEVLPRIQGQGQRGILILHTAEQSPEITNFLQKMLLAVQVDLSQDAYLLAYTPGERLPLGALCRHLPANQLLLFGAHLPDLGFHLELPTYYLMPMAPLKLLLADDLEAIYQERRSGGKKMSGALWLALQEMFANS